VSFLENAPQESGAEGEFWLAQAHAANGEWNPALDFYTRCAGQADFEFSNEARVGQARMLRNLGRSDEAAKILESAADWPVTPLRTGALQDLAELELEKGRAGAARTILQKAEASSPREKSRRDLLLARAAILENDPAAALQLLAPLVPWNAASAVDLVLLHAEALQRDGRATEAENLLEEFIAVHPGIPRLGMVFAALDKIYSASAVASPSELERWASETESTPRRQLAAWHLALFEIRRNNPQAALPLLERLAAESSATVPSARIVHELARIRLRLDQPQEALSLLPAGDSSPETEFLRGLAYARLGDHAMAIPSFLASANDPSSAEPALYNAALCEMLSGIEASPSLAVLKERFPKSPRLAAFPLLQALHKARSGDPSARELLEKAVDSSDPDVSSRARLALAETKYAQLDFQGARLELQKISTQAPSACQEALNVFLADTGESGSEQTAIDLARAFLEKHPDSESTAEVRMKLGELLFRTGNYAAARVELEALARQFPDNENESAALFLAAKSAARIPTPDAPEAAMLLFEEVAAKPGPFAHRARLEQAALQSSLGKPGEANTILDKILATDPDPETKAAALMEKGKNLYAQGESDSDSYKSAIEVWKLILLEKTDPLWRNQALVRIGTAQEKTGDLNAAVATYYEVFKPSTETPVEFFWYYKAGFAAGLILESRQDWAEAIRVYEILAATEGPRTLEARNRIKKIRLENFLWEGD
ncbi:MAG: tetratricopeptide repeat protein, partial [Verrucomicrobiota bacterium]